MSKFEKVTNVKVEDVFITNEDCTEVEISYFYKKRNRNAKMFKEYGQLCNDAFELNDKFNKEESKYIIDQIENQIDEDRIEMLESWAMGI